MRLAKYWQWVYNDKKVRGGVPRSSDIHHNWESALSRAIVTGAFNETDKVMSGSWKTSPVYDRLAPGAQVPQELITLGLEFHNAVVHDEVLRAKGKYERIMVWMR